ncbi:MAG: NAD(P)/FAD-dependent oxidoreductase, partial [archaeon]|nr:NAD(P)/FAD-dependent oxidoreductase [archaeon]
EGAEIILESRVKSVQKRDEEKRLTITTATANGEEEIRVTVVIGADGVKSVVAKMAGLNVTKRTLNCAQIEGEYETEGAFAEIFLGKTIAPGFFAWAIPLGAENSARIGLCIDKRVSSQPNPLLFLKRNLVEHPVIAKRYKGTSSKFTAGRIPIPVGTGWRGHNTVTADKEGGIMLVGDAAAQVKPITGGGVYYGMKCGKIAGEIAAKACLTGDMKLLREYERRWWKEIGKEIAFGLRIHKLRCVMSDKDFDTLLHTLSRGDLLQQIRRTGDMDYPAGALRELVKNPSLIRLMARDILKYLYTKQR